MKRNKKKSKGRQNIKKKEIFLMRGHKLRVAAGEVGGGWVKGDADQGEHL